MRMRPLITAALVAAAAASACGDDGGSDTTPTPNPTSPTPEATAAPTRAPQPTPRVVRTPGAALDIAAARAILDAVLLKPEDIAADDPWVAGNDTEQDNAAAVAARPEFAASVESCGRLLSRTLLLSPEDVAAAFLTASTLAFFSTGTVYATPDGAAQCAAEAAARISDPQQLVQEFPDVFVDPSLVEVELVPDFPQIGDGSFAATLTGDFDANGLTIPLTILVVAFTEGNVSAAVGSARSGEAPPIDELAPLAELVHARIAANQ